MAYFPVKIRLLTLISTLLLIGCASETATDHQWINANEPEELSNQEMQSLKVKATNHDAKAAYHLYTYYLFAENGTAESVYWLKIAASYGYPLAEYNLGVVLSQSSSKKDQREAKLWLNKAAKNGVLTPTK